MGSLAFWCAFGAFALANWLVAVSVFGASHPWALTFPAATLLAMFIALVAKACVRLSELRAVPLAHTAVAQAEPIQPMR